MGSNVLQLIERSAPKKRKQPTTQDIVSLASGGSTSGTTSRTTSASRPKKAKSSTSSSSRTPKGKPSCKYGPRGADGYCPKKPKSNNPTRQTTGNRTKVTARTPTSATTQAIDVVTNPRATKSQKAEAVVKVAEATGTSVVKSAAKKVVKSGKVQKAKQLAIDLAKRVPVGGVLGPVVSAATIVTGVTKPLAKAIDRAEAELRATKKRLPKGQKLTKKQENTLREQYRSYFYKNPNA